MEMILLFGLPAALMIVLFVHTALNQRKANLANQGMTVGYKNSLEVQNQMHVLLAESVALQRKANEYLEQISVSLSGKPNE